MEAGTLHEVSKPYLSSAPAGDVVGVGNRIDDASPANDWLLQTEPQAGANNRKFHIAQGKCLGGSSALSFMIHHRPTKGSLENWAKLAGDESYK